jgi:hypothetical protein
MQITSEYLTKNKDFEKFISNASDNTGRKNMGKWFQNIRENSKIFKKWAATELQGKHRGKTAIIMGASPAISKQIETLKELQYDPDFVLCGISSNLEYLLSNGILPKYTITVDGDESQGVFFDTIDMDKVKNLSLIANLYAYAPMLRKWKGELYFIALQTADRKLEKWQRKWFGKENGIGSGIPSLVSQFNQMAAIASLVFECSILIFVGHELSFSGNESSYYVDRKDEKDAEARFPHGDIYGNKVETSLNLLVVKYSLEGFLEVISGAGWFFNCTEAGIFGITKRFPDRHVPWIKQLTLRNGIAQARQIMRTGEPFYTGEKDSRILVPNMLSRVSLSDFRRFK